MLGDSFCLLHKKDGLTVICRQSEKSTNMPCFLLAQIATLGTCNAMCDSVLSSAKDGVF